MNILDRIVARKLVEISVAKTTVSIVELEKAELFNRECYRLNDFIVNPDKSGIIAEFKRASPSKGIINDKVSVAQVTKGYASAGASALSVLTDHDFFGGSLADLAEARKENEIPILRKEFILDEYQIIEAKAWGADIILLIAAILTPARISTLAQCAQNLGMSILLEVHNKEELNRSLCDELSAVGVNNRNLTDFSVSVQHSYDLVDVIPDNFLKISESGISNIDTINELKMAGFNGFLVGENFMKEADPGQAMQNFVDKLSRI
jgi:indole-3-glycerol phosphate synthase